MLKFLKFIIKDIGYNSSNINRSYFKDCYSFSYKHFVKVYSSINRANMD